MSGGTPVSNGGYVRQRVSQGYGSSSDDLEDDACSRFVSPSHSFLRTRTWTEILENFLWIASAVFIVYYGDRHHNMIFLMWHDDRIRRIPLYIGMFGVGLNVLFFIYTSILALGVRKSYEMWEISSTAALPFITMLGILSFLLFCYALWPIWSLLTLPLVFTLFMACMVIMPYLVLGRFKAQTDLLRTD
ncbi:hypothetical protein BC332_24318 [Capsicum chinense]|uniref:Transmembrane protein 128 n=1 Tax=Capsicum annuum TaxID=4072 RepID=A0A1U8EPC1_CAPAN|nr:uncharacterized protein LOC107848083 isoform X1 [Capsicum annuum]KAF3656759.1 putative F-box/kelch-repeat protein-like [Capsicum annuum]KAF3674062.1 putative F-box/kelch-repeat protein-like [Capsicum annuum]PHT73351.1 hypothetical protein T459_24136 [Capsicum annuum]PHU07829.1 hypothetical protein BC332_24318 [Capsicum chinense]